MVLVIRQTIARLRWLGQKETRAKEDNEGDVMCAMSAQDRRAMIRHGHGKLKRNRLPDEIYQEALAA